MLGIARTIGRRCTVSFALDRLPAASVTLQSAGMPQQTQQIRNMGGGKRSQDQQMRLRAIRKARRDANKLKGPKAPTPIIPFELQGDYKSLCSWKDKPMIKVLNEILPELECFLKDQWLPSYPQGAQLRKLQRDVAFRMPRGLRPGKLTFQELMPMVGHFERKGVIRTKAGRGGRVLIYHPSARVFQRDKLDIDNDPLDPVKDEFTHIDPVSRRIRQNMLAFLKK